MNAQKMAHTPEPYQIDWTGLATIWSVLVAIVTVCFKWINASQQAKKLEKEAFIKSVVETVMHSTLGDMNDKINTLFDYREKDREHIDKKFTDIMKELRGK